MKLLDLNDKWIRNISLLSFIIVAGYFVYVAYQAINVTQLPQIITIIYWAMMLELLLLAVFWFYAGDWIKAILIAWWRKTFVLVEWTKTKRFNPIVANIPKDYHGIAELPNFRGPVGIRRNSIGSTNSKVPMALFSTEFEYTISPQEINGERWYSLDEDTKIYGYVFNGQLMRLTKEDYDKDQLLPEKERKYQTAKEWARYPDMTITPEEFVNFQQIDADPLLTEGYAQHKENALREKMYNPLSALFSNPYFVMGIVTVMIAGWIIYTQLNSQHLATDAYGQLEQCKQNIVTMYQQGICRGGISPINYTSVNTTMFPSGGGIV